MVSHQKWAVLHGLHPGLSAGLLDCFGMSRPLEWSQLKHSQLCFLGNSCIMSPPTSLIKIMHLFRLCTSVIQQCQMPAPARASACCERMIIHA